MRIQIDPKDNQRNGKQRPFQRRAAQRRVNPEAQDIDRPVAHGDGRHELMHLGESRDFTHVWRT